MAFNPALPVNNALIVAEELRNQFNGLKALIDAQAAALATQAAQITSLTTQIATATAQNVTQASQITLLTAELAGLQLLLIPIGSVVLWHKDIPDMVPLSNRYVECNGQVLNDPESPLAKLPTIGRIFKASVDNKAEHTLKDNYPDADKNERFEILFHSSI